MGWFIPELLSTVSTMYAMPGYRKTGMTVLGKTPWTATGFYKTEKKK